MNFKEAGYIKNIFLFLFTVLNIQIFSQDTSDTLKFAFISDIHIGKTEFQDIPLYPTIWLKEALAQISSHNPDFIFIGGDLIENCNASKEYDGFDSVMTTTKIPYYSMPGNHDIGSQDSALSKAISTWIGRGYGRGKYIREFYGFTSGSAAFYIFNTQTFNSSDKEINKRSEIQIAECDSFFTANMSVPVKIILSHVPLFTKSADEEDYYFNIKKEYRNRIFQIMKKYSVKYYIAGHQHINSEISQEGITVYMNTAISFQLGTGNRRGYYIYSSMNNKLLREFYPLD